MNNPSEFLKGRITTIKLMLVNDWDVSIKKLQSLKSKIATSTSFEDFYQWKDEILEIQNNVERLLTHLFVISIITHCSACILYFLPVWVNPENNWVVIRGLENKFEVEKYLHSLHFIIETMMTVGYGDNSYQ